MAAQTLGFRVAVLEPEADSPAGSVADLQIVADYDDPQGLERLAALCAAVTTEFENVPAPSLAWLAERLTVSPGASSVAIAQDRAEEKRFIQACGLAVTPHAVIDRAQDLTGLSAALWPGIMKARRLGYDGKGQVRVADAPAAAAAFAQLGHVPCVLEKQLDLAFEVSVVVARAQDGSAASYPIAQNVHRHGILALTTIPSPRIGVPEADAARAAALLIAQSLDYIGVLCVEFFVLQDGTLVVNEIAPRPHNSGHYSIDASVVSQFEQQARILAGLPLGSSRLHSPAMMLNLLGDLWFGADGSGSSREPDWAALLRHPGAKLHLYGKREARPGRKMGHVTIVGETAAEVLVQARAIAAGLGLKPW